MERCGRCEAEGRSSIIKGIPHRISYNGMTLVVCNLCLTELQDEIGMITSFTGIYEDEED